MDSIIPMYHQGFWSVAAKKWTYHDTRKIEIEWFNKKNEKMKKKKLIASFKVRPWTKPCRSSAPLSLWWILKRKKEHVETNKTQTNSKAWRKKSLNLHDVSNFSQLLLGDNSFLQAASTEFSKSYVFFNFSQLLVIEDTASWAPRSWGAPQCAWAPWAWASVCRYS